MILAIPIWNGRISPLLDSACRILICRVEPGGDSQREEHDLNGLLPPVKVRRIKELGADVLICGAVSNRVAPLVARADIELVPWISGPVDEVIEAFRAGRLDEPRYFMPGCMGGGVGGRRRRQRRRGGCGRFKAGDF